MPVEMDLTSTTAGGSSKTCLTLPIYLTGLLKPSPARELKVHPVNSSNNRVNAKEAELTDTIGERHLLGCPADSFEN